MKQISLSKLNFWAIKVNPNTRFGLKVNAMPSFFFLFIKTKSFTKEIVCDYFYANSVNKYLGKTKVSCVIFMLERHYSRNLSIQR